MSDNEEKDKSDRAFVGERDTALYQLAGVGVRGKMSPFFWEVLTGDLRMNPHRKRLPITAVRMGNSHWGRLKT